MPKSIPIDPDQARSRSEITSATIPVNQYVPDPAREREQYGSEALVRMYRDMAFIRQFETLLADLKRSGKYRDVDYVYAGPAHLSIGQEASAVGQSVHLGIEDVIFGSHRSHGEILAKGLSAIERLSETELLTTMESYLDGAILGVVETFSGGGTRDLATDYLLYGTLAEIFGKATGFNLGMGGSMHVFFPPFGIMPNNAIVGGSGPIAVGAALFRRINRRPGIVIANIGDSAIACGPVWEAMNLSAMDQYRTLWDPDIGGNPPILFNFVDNFYGMGGQPQGETLGVGVLARVGLGVNPEGMHAERVDGMNPLAVADAIQRKRVLLERGRGPVLLDTITYRYSGHSPSDASSYRDEAEMELWRHHDPLTGFHDYLTSNGHASDVDLDTIDAAVADRLHRVMRAAASSERSPLPGPAAIEGVMFSGRSLDRMAPGVPEVLIPKEESRLVYTRQKHRAGIVDGEPVHRLQAVSYAEALFEAMIHRLYEDPTMVAFGEENRDWGGAFAVYRGLTQCLPYHRLFNTPIAEAAIVGAAVGYALSGGRVVAELMYADFIGRAGDEIFNQMAKWQAMSGGQLLMPLVLRVSVGSSYGAQHSQDWSSLLAHIPGLQVMYPATPYDAKGMLNLALRGTDPVVFFESQRLYPHPERVVEGGVPVEYYEVELGAPAVRRSGTDLTLVTIGPALYRALEAAALLAERYRVSATVIDARFLTPLDYRPIVDSVRATGRAVLVSDASERGSFLHTMASTITATAFDDLRAPVAVVGARNWITPSVELETSFFPQISSILDTIHQRVLPLEGHQPSGVEASEELLRRSRHGV